MQPKLGIPLEEREQAELTRRCNVGAMLLFKKPAGRTPIVREIVEA